MGDVLPFPDEASPEEVARQWIIRIDRGPLTAEERATLQAWLAQDSRHGELLDQHARLWHAAGKAAIKSRPRAEKAANSPYWKLAGAAGMAAAVATAVVIWSGMPGPGRDAASVLQTAVGQHQHFAMKDGSRIELNTKSKAVVDYRPSQRQIVLLDGEGYFEVAKDKARPFTVVAGATTVRAVGTRFSVRRRGGGRVDVVVSEGVVQVTQHDSGDKPGGGTAVREARLVAGQSLTSNTVSFAIAPVSREKMAQLLAWQQGRVNFDKTPLSAALEEMSRYAAVPIVAGDAGALSIRISGAFATDNVELFLRTLERGFDLRIHKRAEKYVVLSGRKA